MKGLFAVLMVIGLCEPLQAARLVVAGGAITEIVYALGGGDDLVAVDATSRWPMAARKLPNIGYVRALSAEGIAALRPDHVLLSHDAGPDHAVAKLSRLAPVTRLTAVTEPAALPELVREVASLINRKERGEKLAASLEFSIEQLKGDVNGAAKPRVLFLLSAGSHGVMVAGHGTPAQSMLDWLALENAAADIEGYKPLSREAALMLEPDVLIVAETQLNSFQIANHSELSHTEAVRHGRVLIADAGWLLGLGPRLPEALQAVIAVASVGESH
ncbi:MAG: ABC transporter substrate-binding protein [Gammaproteobacteria bacterium HGW-Gammaproteobacteria-14]|nr:MAG: ABC transporter substrate-binding protein [Gammaproteobacteria bacterium HGW-Gammaproteobacteria-14]